jgi:deoxyribose-phosphate aldolase
MNSLPPDAAQLAAAIDHTILKPGTLVSQVETLCEEAIAHGFAAVCVPPMFVKQAKARCLNTGVQTATVIGFPFGYCAVEAKLAEILLAIVDGADELDVVINFTAIKNNDWPYLANEINHLLPVVHGQGKKIKVIIESGVLTDDEIIRCCELYGAAGVDFMKTSTGYAEKGATVEAVALMRRHLPDNVAIKASGGIRSADFARQLMQAGATRLGTSSGIALVKDLQPAQGNY